MKNVACTALVLLAATTAATITQADTIAYWRFEDNGDSEVNGKYFNLDLSPSAQFVDDTPAAFIECDGKKLPNTRAYENGSKEVGSTFSASELLDQAVGDGSFTIEGFLKLNYGAAAKKFMRVIGNAYYLENPGGWVIAVTEGKLTFSALQGLGTNEKSPHGILTATTPLSENEWHHFAVVGYRDPEKLVVRLFVDGVESEVERPVNFYAAKPGGKAIVPNPDNYMISAKNNFQGLLDEIRISNEALDISEFLRAVR